MVYQIYVYLFNFQIFNMKRMGNWTGFTELSVYQFFVIQYIALCQFVLVYNEKLLSATFNLNTIGGKLN